MRGLRWVRDHTACDALARDHGISRATAYRYVEEFITVLADMAPERGEALGRAEDDGFSHVILDGTVIACDRCKEPAVSVKGEIIDLWYSGKAHTHGGNIQAVLAPNGFPLWVSDVEPGSVHDITAARAHALPALDQAAAAGLPTLPVPPFEPECSGPHAERLHDRWRLQRGGRDDLVGTADLLPVPAKYHLRRGASRWRAPLLLLAMS